MIGVIHRVLLDLIASAGGQDAVDRVRELAGVAPDADFKLQVAYDDAQWRSLLAATCTVLGLTTEQAEEAYAEAFLQDALRRWPVWFQMSGNSREFLERQPAIHNSLGAGMRDECARRDIADKFRIERNDDGLVTHYRSPNRHCGLYTALARRVVAHYGDEVTITESRCQRRGDEECEIHIAWTRIGALR